MDEFTIPIGTVERETGFSKDLLRKWEQRYCFPDPARSAGGRRLYSSAQIQRLRRIKRLLDAGLRPAQAMALDDADATALLDQLESPSPPLPTARQPLVNEVIDALMLSMAWPVKHLLQQQLMQHGVDHLVLRLIAPLNGAIGDAWASGRIAIHQEHLYAQAVIGLLHGVIADVGGSRDEPPVLLATPPGELHTLGLHMLHALLGLRGCNCVSLGAQVPIGSLLDAVQCYRPEIVALSFSRAYPKRECRHYLSELRERLAPRIQIWAGGDGVTGMSGLLPGITCYSSLEAVLLEHYGEAG